MVKSERRGLRIGHQLCAHSLIKAKEVGYKAMQFNLVVSTNKGAIKRGWTMVLKSLALPQKVFIIIKKDMLMHIFSIVNCKIL
ncbi:hypothetical protein [Aquimarina aggregata]|uniref:hypothetical protein n=1 Tax=Aquimarina aggregata TaxID=1642818 RepID=UPI00248FD135|nr:hypothetical protein [Aquimarina aggregata]